MIRLRALEPEDLDLLYTIENDRRLWHVSNTAAPYSRYALRQYIAEGQTLASCGQLRQVICAADSDRAVGLIDLFAYEPKHRRAETAIALLADERGKGYGAAALRQLCREAEHLHHLHTLYAVVGESNRPSLRLYADADFACRAVLPDWIWTGERFESASVLVRTFGAAKEAPTSVSAARIPSEKA